MNRRNALIDMLSEPPQPPRNRLTDILGQPSTADVYATLDQTVTNRGNFVPLVEYASGRVGPGWPNFLPGHKVADMLTPGYNYDSPQAARDAFDVAGMVGAGSLAAPRPRGSIGSGGRVRDVDLDLPMDQPSRLGRVADMGFYTNLPLYHGTATPDGVPISAFNLGKGGATSGAAPGRLGIWAALSPGVADEFASRSSQNGAGNPQVLPLLHRAEKPAVVHLTGDEKNLEISATLASAWDDGYDAVMFRNYTSPQGQSGQTILVVKDPAQLRSPNAAFDPKKRSSADLLAARGLPFFPQDEED